MNAHSFMTLPAFPDTPRQRLQAIVAECAHDFITTPAAIMGPSRAQPEAMARQEAYLRLRTEGWSYPRIGRALDRDHTTVISGVKAAIARRATA